MKLDLKTGLIIVAVLLVATVGSAYITSWVFSNRAAMPAEPLRFKSESTSTEQPFNPELIWDAGPFTVNLASSGNASRFIKTGMSFRVNEKETIGELEKRRVQIRDKVITILRTTTAAELADTDGITHLKNRVMGDVNELIVDDGGRVHAVYLTELVIQ